MKTDKPEVVGTMFEQLKEAFYTEKTFDFEYRKTQLRNLANAFESESEEICRALKEDLGRDRNNAMVTEVIIAIAEIQNLIKNMDSYLATEVMDTPIVIAPAKSKIVYQPMGTWVVIGTWNVPFVSVMKPLANTIAAGNTALVKPSEMSPAASAVIRRLVEDYLDNECYKVGMLHSI